MKPTDKELRDKYLAKLERARERVTEVQLFYSKLEPREGLEHDLLRFGCKVMIANLNGHIQHCKLQVKKFSKMDSHEFDVTCKK